VASAVPAPIHTAREAMIDSQLKPCGVVSPRTVAAFFSVAREDFVAPDRRRLAYVDAAQPLGNGREMMAPLSLGYLVEDAAATPEDKVLVVGATTGYAAAIMSQMAGHVVALESDPALAERRAPILHPMPMSKWQKDHWKPAGLQARPTPSS
jgi:protein-L-isoaspartate(D-aspartate) O-methyltransferase